MSTILGVSGEAGSFSEEAAMLYAKRASIDPTLRYLIDMEGVLAAVETGTVDIGIFPVVNLLGGLVKPAFQAMGNHLFTPIDELWLEINQCLLALPGTALNQITTIVSHPQGLAQCKHYIQKTFKDVKRIEWIDTAKAAKDLAEGLLPDSAAVIAPERSADIYGLNVVARNIQDSNPNLTAFIVAKKHSSTRIDMEGHDVND